MPSIDTQFLYLLLGILFILIPISVYLATIEFHDQQVYLWCIGGLGAGIGMSLISLRGNIPDFFSYYIAQAAVIVGYICRALAIRYELNKNFSKFVKIYVVIGFLYLTSFSYLVASQQPEALRLILVMLAQLALSIDLLVISLKNYRITHNKGNQLIAVMALLIMLSMAVSIIIPVLTKDSYSVFSSGLDKLIPFTLMLSAYVLGNFGFVQMRLDKLWKKQLAIKDELVVTQLKQKSLEEIIQEKNHLLKALSLSSKANNMGAMLGAIAHEVNQPLTAMRLSTELLINKPTTSPQETQEILGSILRDNIRASDLVKNLRQFFSSKNAQFEKISLNGIIFDVQKMLDSELHLHQIEFRTHLKEDVSLLGDKNQLQMVILNLLTNAIDAVRHISGNKKIEIQTQRTEKGLEILVEDNGSGIPEEQCKRLFNIFETSKDEGMGIGLWLSKIIIDNHQGTLDLVHTSPSGTCFRIQFSKQRLFSL